MATKHMLRVGDTVNWSGSWGTDAARPAVVEAIERTHVPGDKYGDSVQELSWDIVTANRAVVSLTNGHWAYGHQIAPVTK